MEKETYKKNIIIGSLALAIIIIVVLLFVTKFSGKKITSVNTLAGSYAYIKTITNEDGVEQKITVKVIFNKDNTATYEIKDNHNVEMTKGTFTYNDGKITYTKENYNLPNNNEKYEDTLDKIIEFEVYEKNKLKQIDEYYGQTVILERVN